MARLPDPPYLRLRCPAALLDPGAQIDAPVLPIQYALPGSRPSLVDGSALLLLAVILLPLGFLAYGRGIERARGTGTLTRWQ